MIKIQDKEQCSGCGACYSVCPKKCIKMVEDEEGFLYPMVNADICIKCGICEKVCPLVEINNKKKGVVHSCIIQHKDEEVLRESTSGGGFTPIAEYVINQGGVVFGVEMKEDDFFVKHIRIEEKSDLTKFRNSKYVQSNIGDTFKQTKEELEKGRMVCYSGTPCQIQGLKNYLKVDYNNLITIDVVCRGVPSPGVWKKYTDYLKTKGKIKKILFRDKELGYQYSTMKVEYEDGKIERNGIESDQWLRMFFSGMILRPSCPTCNFRTIERCSDFTIWDCFNVSDLTTEIDETKGSTRMIVHTEKGMNIFKKIESSFVVVNTPIEIVVKGLNDTFELHENREEFFQDYLQMDIKMLLDKWFPMTITTQVMKGIRRVLNQVGLDILVKKIKRRIKG